MFRTALCLTPAELQMQRELFRLGGGAAYCIPDGEMWRILGELRALSALASFRLWLVGSRVEPGRPGSDVDLVLSPRDGCSPGETNIEAALWYCRYHALHVASPLCVVDPCFRERGPTRSIEPLRPSMVVTTVKLLSPKIVRLIRDGRIRNYRRLGRFSIEVVRSAEETAYYPKLPRRDFEDGPCAYLRPGVEIPLSGELNGATRSITAP